MPTENKKGKHLTFAERVTIEHCLSFRWRLSEIAEKLGKDPTTISKEIRKNRILRGAATAVPCVHKQGCSVMNLCSPTCSRLCVRCRDRNCYRQCDKYAPKPCNKLKKYPYVCNGCDSREGRTGCFYAGFYYKAGAADANYREKLTACRQGIDLSVHEFEHLDNLISPLIKKGQSIYHIYTHHKDEIGVSQRTLYNFFGRDLFTAKNIDLPRKVRYKKRKKRKLSVPSAQKHSFGRTYEDFLNFTEQFPNVQVVEMDTLKGRIEKGKVLLTLFFRNSSFMLAFLLDSCKQKHVKRIFDLLYDELGHDVFTTLFPIILTDNGSEMKSPLNIELAPCGRQRTTVFYCHPMNSNQKARLEKNHEYLRYIFPKGKLFDSYSQEDITLAVNHINSTARASLNGSCPHELAHLLLDHSLFTKFNLIRIPADDVTLKPLLLKK